MIQGEIFKFWIIRLRGRVKTLSLIQWSQYRGKQNMHEKPYRSVCKTISWRTVGTLDTMIILILTGNLVMAASIGSIEVITKMIFIIFMKEFGINYLLEE